MKLSCSTGILVGTLVVAASAGCGTPKPGGGHPAHGEGEGEGAAGEGEGEGAAGEGEGEGTNDPCGGSCFSNPTYTACTCGAADPCSWNGDGVCDSQCSQFSTNPFHDRDCDPCGGIPETGDCADTQTVEFCGSATDQGVPTAFTYACPPGENCAVTGGFAGCVLSGSCLPGETLCLDATHLQTCVSGQPTTTICAGSCLSNALGAQCASTDATTVKTGTLKYTVRGPNSDFSDWDTTTSDVRARS